jgi:SAM-dependent methyltransferase
MSESCSRVLADVHRVLAREVGRLAASLRSSRRPAVLDVGCWDGAATDRYARALDARALGIEVFEAPARAAEARGIEVARIDLETQPFPWPDGSVDVVVCNQVFEHLKNVWGPMAEIHRVLRPGGFALLSVPNLGSLHNRVLLALGRQPTSIRTFGPHVRGFTRREFERFVTHGGGFTLERSLGVGFPPLSPPWTRPLAAIWPGGSHTLAVVARRTEAVGAPWLDHLRAERDSGVQTYYG